MSIATQQRLVRSVAKRKPFARQSQPLGLEIYGWRIGTWPSTFLRLQERVDVLLARSCDRKVSPTS